MSRVCSVGLLILAAAFFGAGGTLAAETLPGEPDVMVEFELAPQPAVPADEWLAIGRVVAVDRDAGRVTLEFRPIPQLLLEGGTRIFRVEVPASLASLRPGAKVRFEVRRQGRNYTITRIENRN
jgi:Cu/Ag efflux protein CusF